MQTSVGSDTARLAKLSAKDGSVLEEIASDPKADAGKILHDPDTNAPVAVAFDRLKSKWTVVDKEVSSLHSWPIILQKAISRIVLSDITWARSMSPKCNV